MFRRASACLLLVLFIFTVWPRTSQATGVSLAIIGASALGAAIASSGAASYYAPAVYSAANTAVSSAGKIAHQVYEAQKVVTALGTYYVGKAVSELVDLSGAGWAWIQSHASSIPSLYATMSPYATASSNPVTGDVIQVMNPDGSLYATYKVGAQYATGSYLPSYQYRGVSSSQTVAGLPVLIEGNGMYLDFFIDPVLVTYQGSLCWQVSGYITYYYSADNTDPVTILPTTFDAASWAANYSSSAANDQDIESLAGQPGAPVSFVDSPTAAGAFSAPPVGQWGSTQEGQSYNLAGAQAQQDSNTAIQNLAASDPTNTTAQILATQSATQAAQTDLQAQAQQAADNPTLPALATPTVPDFDFSPLIALKDEALTKFPFSLANEVGTFVGALVGPAETPAFTVPLGTFGTMNVDLHVWDDEMSWFRSLIAFLFYASVVYFIIKRWSS